MPPTPALQCNFAASGIAGRGERLSVRTTEPNKKRVEIMSSPAASAYHLPPPMYRCDSSDPQPRPSLESDRGSLAPSAVSVSQRRLSSDTDRIAVEHRYPPHPSRRPGSNPPGVSRAMPDPEAA